MPITGWPSASGTRHGQRSKTKRPSACVGRQAAKEFGMRYSLRAPSAPWALRSHALCTLDHPATGKTRAGAGVRFARPNIQIRDPHVVDLVPMCLCAVSRWCEGCRSKGRQSAVKLGSRPNFRRDHVGFRNPIPTGSQKLEFALYFNMIWQRWSQSIPTERSSIFHFPGPKPTV
jgi:hypothetical protein